MGKISQTVITRNRRNSANPLSPSLSDSSTSVFNSLYPSPLNLPLGVSILPETSKNSPQEHSHLAMSAQAGFASTPTQMFVNSSHTSRGPWLVNLSFTFSLSKLLGFLFPSRLREYLGLALFGLLAELTRRAVIRLLPWIERQISIQAIHPVYDPSHDWVMSWWMSQPSWTKRSKVL